MTYWAEKRLPTLPPEQLRRIPDDVPRWKIAYWQFQNSLTREYVIPMLSRWSALPREGRMLEVGAGEGGCLAALAAETGLPADALEISASRAELGRVLNSVLMPDPPRIIVGDIARDESLADLTPPYSFVLLRDVIEHVEDLGSALRICRGLIPPDGVIMMTFPPYLSPFGAHQQILSRAGLRLPWLHLLPGFVSRVRRREPVAGKIDEIEGLARCRLTIGSFESACRDAQLESIAVRHYLLRPAFRYRYGLPVVGASFVGRMPGIRELLVTGSWHLLRRRSRA